MRITESRLRRIIREELLSEARKLPPVETFLRFGDPRAVKDGVSVIHDPLAYAYAEEPALYGIGDGESYNLRSEAGISAYPVVEDGNTITFKVGNGIGPFSGQLGNFLLDRLMAGDVWVFKARRIPSMELGTDSEPLIDGRTVKSVRKVDTSSLRVTDRSSGGGERLLDLLDPWDLDGYLNMGYNEFFKTQDIPREKITDFLGSLKARFSTPKQLKVLSEIEEIWLDDWDEDHLSKSGRD